MPEWLAQVFGEAAHAQTSAARAIQADSLRVSLLDLLRLRGDDSAAALLLLAVLCVLPIAGIGTVLGFGIRGIAARWRGGADTHGLPGRLERVVLSGKWARRCLRALSWVYASAERFMRARWTSLCHRRSSVCWGLWIALMALLILLPLPLGNVLPALSLVLLSLGWMFRDGMVLILSACVGTAAVAFAVAMGDVIATGILHGWHWTSGLI